MSSEYTSLNDYEANIVSFDTFINRAEVICPEISAKRNQLLEMGSHILAAHSVGPRFMCYEDNRIGLLLGAALQLEANQADGKSEYRHEREVVIAQSYRNMLTRRYVAGYEDPVHILSGSEKVGLIQQLKDEALSEQITQVLSERTPPLYEALGLDPADDTFMPMEICALNISDERSVKVWQNFFEDIGLHYPYGPEAIDTQIENGVTYLRALGSQPNARLPKAVTSYAEGRSYICIPAHWAQVVAHGSQVAQLLDPTDATASFDHEFIHTKGTLRHVENNASQQGTNLGRGLEEIRAEAFSGGNCQRIYRSLEFVDEYVEEYGGISLHKFMRTFKCGGVMNKCEFYLSLADRFGLWTAGILTCLDAKEAMSVLCGDDSQDIELSESVHNRGPDILFKEISYS